MTRPQLYAGAVGIALMVTAASLVAAQASKGFEAATLKINTSGGNQIRLDVLPRSGRINAVNIPMRTLLAAAFRVRGEQLINAPAWVDRTRVDLVAKVDPSLTGAQVQDLLVPLLADLAKLKFHRDMRDMDVYELVLAKDGQLGPNLTRSPNDCGTQPNVPLNQTAASNNPLNADARPRRPDGTPACGPVPGGPGHVIMHGSTMEGWTNWMTGLRMADRPVVDATELTGAYDFDVKYTPDALSSAALAARAGGAGGLPPGLAALASQVDPDGPSLRQALQDQLGLKLEPKRAPREVIVIDQIEMPVE